MVTLGPLALQALIPLVSRDHQANSSSHRADLHLLTWELNAPVHAGKKPKHSCLHLDNRQLPH